MRVTLRMLTESTTGNINRNLERLERLQQQLTSGKRLSRPSDDAPAVARALTYRAGVMAGEQYLKTMDSAATWLNATDASLEQATQALQRARELAVQGANSGTLTPDQQAAIAAEIGHLIEHLVDIGNSSLRGQRLFAGLQTSANPFALNAGPPTTVTYNGDTGAMLREIDVGVTVQINTPGDSTFNPAFNALISLRDHLLAGDANAITSTDLGAIDSAINTVMTARAAVGARVNLIDSARGRQEELQVRLTDLQSKEEETDFAEAASAFALQETLYRAALQSGARAIQPSLLDYLR